MEVCSKSHHTSGQVVVDIEDRATVESGRRGRDTANAVEGTRGYATTLRAVDKEVGYSQGDCTAAG